MSNTVKEGASDQLSTQRKKKIFLQAMEANMGNISQSCKSANISRQTFYNWKREDETFMEQIDEIVEGAIDFAESKLLEKISGVQMVKYNKDGPIIYELAPSDTAIIFFLKTRGKDRGYIERQEFTGKDGADLYSNLSDEELDDELDQIGKDKKA